MINEDLVVKPQDTPAVINYLISDPLAAKGWVKDSLGQYRSNGQIKDKEGFKLYTRRRNLNDFTDDYSQKSSSDSRQKPPKDWASDTGSSMSMGHPELKLTPSVCDGEGCLRSSDQNKTSLPALSSFSEYPSLMSARKDMPCLLIGYDSEWENLESGREMLSWQYALVDGEDLIEFVFLKDGDVDLSLMDALGCIMDHLDKYKAVDIRTIRRYKYCTEWKNNKPIEVVTDDVQKARDNCKYVFRRGIGFTRELIREMPDKYIKRANRDWAWFHSYLDFSLVESIKVCIVCHAGKVDLSALSFEKKNLLRYLTEIQGGLATLQPVRYAPKSMKNVNNTCIYAFPFVLLFSRYNSINHSFSSSSMIPASISFSAFFSTAVFFFTGFWRSRFSKTSFTA